MKGTKIGLLLIVLMLTLSISVFASPQKEETESEEQVVVRLAWWTNEVRTAVTLETIAAYEALHPNVKIVPEYTGWAGYWDKLATQIAANDAPDIVQLVDNRLTEFVDGGIIAALDEYDMDFDKVDSAALDTWSQNRKKYGLPAGLNGWAVLYNPDIFDKAGVSYPTADWTWADFERIANTIHDNTKLYGVSFVLMYQDLPFLARGAGYSLFSEDGKSFGFTDYSFLTEYLSMMDRLEKSGALIEHSFTEENFNNFAANPMAFGEAAMLFIPSNQASPVNDGVGKALPFMTIPGTAKLKSNILAAALGYSMSASTANPEIAADIINFFGSSPEALAIGKANRGVPATAEARSYMLKQGLDPTLAAAFEYVDIASPVSSPLEWSANPKQAEINDLCDEIFAKVMFNELTPAAAAAEFYQRGNEILAR